MLKKLQFIRGKKWQEGWMDGIRDFSSVQSSNHKIISALNQESSSRRLYACTPIKGAATMVSFSEQALNPKSRGFTLIELTIVIALMMILYAIATPSLRNLAPSSRLKSSAREIRSTLKYARDVAMTENTAYLVTFDLDEQRYWLASSEDFNAEDATLSLAAASSSAISTSQQNTSVGEEEGSIQGQFGSPRTVMLAGIPKKPATGVEIAAINITHDYSSYNYDYVEPELSTEAANFGEEITTGTEYIYFTPEGTSEDMILYLRDKTGKIMSVQVARKTGQVSIRKESEYPGEQLENQLYRQ